VSSFEPGVNHLLGWLLKRRTGIPWLADFGDPWVNQNTPGWRRGLDFAIERRLVDRIDAVSVTTQGLAAVYEKQYPRLGTVHVVPQGFDPDMFAGLAPDRLADSNSLNLVYTGTLYPELRNPSAVFSALRLLREKGLNVQLTIAGRVPLSMIEETLSGGELDGVVRFLGVVAHKRALALQKGADVLLHLDNCGADLQMPGKLYEYLGAGRPVLVVRHGQPHASAAARCVRMVGCGRDAPDEPHAIAEALEAFTATSRNLRDWEPAPDAVARYSYARSADSLCAAIEQAIGGSSARPVRIPVPDGEA
jgi:glycosyltransferase involved in cell wall biosynthesis